MNNDRERRSLMGLYWPRALLALPANNTMKCNNLFLLLEYAKFTKSAKFVRSAKSAAKSVAKSAAKSAGGSMLVSLFSLFLLLINPFMPSCITAQN